MNWRTKTEAKIESQELDELFYSGSMIAFGLISWS